MKRALVVLIVLCPLASCVSMIQHSQESAALAATEFARVAFVDRDDSKAHGLLSPSLAQRLTPDELAESIAGMHPGSFPTQVVAVEYEPIFGQRAMMIYLEGAGDGEDFRYRFVMEGDASSGYRVGGLFRGNGPYPPSGRRPLQTEEKTTSKATNEANFSMS